MFKGLSTKTDPELPDAIDEELEIDEERWLELDEATDEEESDKAPSSALISISATSEASRPASRSRPWRCRLLNR